MNEATLVLTIPVCDHVKDGLGRPVVIRELVRCAACGCSSHVQEVPERCPMCNAEKTTEGKPALSGGEPLPKDRQMTIGQNLLDRLSQFRPERREHTLWVQRVFEKISRALDEGKDYSAGQTALGLLQEAWRQSTDKPPDQGGYTAFVDGQIGRMLGIEEPTSDTSMVGIVDDAEEDMAEADNGGD